ncbi:hypothetical protein SDC9_141330 [bioreactor metagenome]|uniref:Uncharacterized protein n=1 Tax=bioreactor metagenome TaxID=1076179 RepID=A0A645DXZ7_9ZZZZ|nr:hypothetical protein M918_17210 [Clostridium sp. BL8]
MVNASIFLKDPIDIINKRDYVSLEITFYFELASFVFVYELSLKDSLLSNLRITFLLNDFES